jgi:uncharacterized protein (UPF0335 family)
MNIGNNTKELIKSTIERIENLEEEKNRISDNIKDLYKEAKSSGLDVKALRAIVRDRKKDAIELAEHEAIVESYKHALGMLNGTPLGQAAIERATA